MKREICEKCKHYVQHYVNIKYLRFKYARCGHCNLGKTKQSQSKCNNFEPINHENSKQNNVSVTNKISFHLELLTRSLAEMFKQIDLINEKKDTNEF